MKSPERPQALRERVSSGESAPAGRVRAAAATQAIVHLFAPLFEAFMKAQPRIDVSFRTTASTEETVADILNGAADVLGDMCLTVSRRRMEAGASGSSRRG